MARVFIDSAGVRATPTAECLDASQHLAHCRTRRTDRSLQFPSSTIWKAPIACFAGSESAWRELNASLLEGVYSTSSSDDRAAQLVQPIRGGPATGDKHDAMAEGRCRAANSEGAESLNRERRCQLRAIVPYRLLPRVAASRSPERRSLRLRLLAWVDGKKQLSNACPSDGFIHVPAPLHDDANGQQ